MPIRGQSVTITYTAWSSAAQGPLAGDVSHHTLFLVRDGVVQGGGPTNHPADIGGGEYSLALTATEVQCAMLTLGGSSTTTGVAIVPVKLALDPPMAGPGSSVVTLTFYSNPPTNTIPIANASIWVSTDSAGEQVVAGPISTDTSGNAKFLLTAGDIYYVWLEKSGVDPILGSQFTAVADG